MDIQLGSEHKAASVSTEVPSFFVSRWLDTWSHDPTRLARLETQSGVDRARLDQEGGSLAWDEVARLFEVALDLYGPDALVDAGKRFVDTLVEARSVWPLMGDARATMMIAIVVHRVFLPFSVGLEERPDGALEATIALPPSLRPSEGFFHSMRGTLTRLPVPGGYAEAEVDARIEARRVVYTIRVPRERVSTPWSADVDPTQSRSSRVVTLFGALARSAASLLSPGNRSVQELQARHGLTRPEARVVARIGQGSSVTETAKELSVGVETVRTHLKRSFAKLGVHRQAELVKWWTTARRFDPDGLLAES